MSWYRTMDQWEKSDRVSQFLIDGLLSSKMTILSGAPKAGKSLLSVAMVAALVEGAEEFLGHRVNRRLDRVAFGLTDPDAPGETAMRLFDVISDPSRIVIAEIRPDGTPDYWQRHAAELRAQGVDLFVLDNVLGAIKGDVADGKDARDFMDQMDSLMREGIAVLIVTHTPKEGRQFVPSGASSPIGGRIFGARPRVICTLWKSKKSGLRLEVNANHAESVTVPLHLDIVNDAPRFLVREDSKSTKGSGTRSNSDYWTDMADDVVRRQPEQSGDMRPLARVLSLEYGKSSETIRKRLGSLIEWNKERQEWVRTPHLAAA